MDNQKSRKKNDSVLLSAFPLSNTSIALVFQKPVHPAMTKPNLYRLKSGLKVKTARLDPKYPERLILDVGQMITTPPTPDQVIITNLKMNAGESMGKVVSPMFLQGIHTPMELKVPHFNEKYPFNSTLVNFHVSVMCCTGCNGGVHHRNLVVLNNHSGGSWSSIWIRTAKKIEGPYPRWERVLFAGGVIEEQDGSTTVVDKGWMILKKGFEEPHHAPPPLPVSTEDLPMKYTEDLLAKSFDATWVQFNNITIDSVKSERFSIEDGKKSLARIEIVFHDNSGVKSIAWLYIESALKLKIGQKVKMLRGFVHAEKPGQYILLSDKEEDIEY